MFITNPAAGTWLTSLTTFNWKTIPGATQYWVRLEDDSGTRYFDADRGTSRYYTIRTALPGDGRNLRFYLRYKVAGVWYVMTVNYR